MTGITLFLVFTALEEIKKLRSLLQRHIQASNGNLSSKDAVTADQVEGTGQNSSDEAVGAPPKRQNSPSSNIMQEDLLNMSGKSVKLEKILYISAAVLLAVLLVASLFMDDVW